MKEAYMHVLIRPIAKQSTSFSSNKSGKKGFTPKRYLDWKREFTYLSRPQVAGKRFEKLISMRAEYIFRYPKNWPSRKAREQWPEDRKEQQGYHIIGGEEVRTLTPDLHDNLSKLPIDTLSEMRVISKDCLIYEAHVKKLWGPQDCIRIWLKGL